MTTHDEADLDSGSELPQSVKRNADTSVLARIFTKSKDKVDQRLAKLYNISQSRNLSGKDGSLRMHELVGDI